MHRAPVRAASSTTSSTRTADALTEAGIAQLHVIGDAYAPGIIAQATFSGHRLAREIDSPNPDEPLPFIRERRLVGATEADFVLGSATLAHGLDVAAG